MALRKFGPVVGQEMMYFDGPLTIDLEHFNRQEAMDAAQRRKKRTGELSLRQIQKHLPGEDPTKRKKRIDRTSGFRKASDNLWVPHSKTELNAVFDGTKLFRRKQYNLVEGLILEKYAKDENDISPLRIAAWARFGGTHASQAAAAKFDDWRQDAWGKFNAMKLGIGWKGEIRRSYVVGNNLVLDGIKTYLADLKSFIGHEDMMTQGEKRQWMQPRWTGKLAVHDQWASNYLDTLQDLDLEHLTAEAYYNHRSRYQYWSTTLAHDENLSHDVQVFRYFAELNSYIEGKE